MILPDLLSAAAQNIIDKKGTPEQLNQLMEECGELIAAANHYLRSWKEKEIPAIRSDAMINLKDEMIDVVVVLDQLMERIGMTEEEFKLLADYKIGRQIGRMEK